MKLLVVTPYFYPKVGGLESYAYNICKGLRENYGWEVVVITSNHEEKKYNIETIEGIKIYRLPAWFKLSNTPINPLWYFMIRKIITNERPDIINAHTPVPFIADIATLASKKIPVVITYQAGTLLKNKLIPDMITGLYQTTFLKLMLSQADKIICVSDYVKNSFLKTYNHKSTVITPGVDTDLFKPAPIKEPQKNILLCVGGLKKAENYKRLEDIFYAVSLLKEKQFEIQLVVVGEGDNENYFKELSKKLHIAKQVIFRGKLVGNDLVTQYQQSNVLVLASVNESFGMVLIEAMACKVPVIGANTCGIPYVIDNKKNGLLFPPGDKKVLSETILHVLQNDRYAKSLAENGYKKVLSDFTWLKQIKKTHDLFTTLL